MNELDKKKETFYHENENGSVDIIDVATGDIIETVDRLCDQPMKYCRYNEILAAIVCQRIAGGTTLSKLCKEPGMPSYQTLLRWRKKYPYFKEAVEEARKDRAEYYAEEVVEVSKLATDKDDSPAIRVRIDALKWSAQAFHPDKFSPKTKIVGDPDQPISFIVDTGVRRKGDPGYVNINPLEVNQEGQLPPKPVMEGNDETSSVFHESQKDLTPNLITGGEEDAKTYTERASETKTETKAKTEAKAPGEE